MNSINKLRFGFRILSLQDPILRRCFQTCQHIGQYANKVDESHSKEEVEILLKSNTPEQVTVSDSSDPVKIRAASSFYSTSIFQDELVSKFVNCMMYGGKKAVSQRVMEDTFEQIKKIQLEKYRKATDKDEIELDPLQIFHTAIANVKPILGVQTMKKKGKKLQVPYPLPDNRRRFLAIKWMLTTARGRPGNTTPMSVKLSREILDAYKNEGTVVQKKIDYHKRAELLRAFAHYRWW
ncbi:small ribosomal subunit protein uS7m-like [Clytia hemisphaerica]|uniref:small ribosomal subunit protein uS7m-like n=1 Tax=Clytia hemisphaerica TaxID=252671 RepID=UPI0034D49177